MTNNRTLKVIVLFIDLIILLISYNLIYHLRFDEWSPGFLLNLSFAKVFLSCTFAGYILGAFSLVESGTRWQNVFRFFLSICVGAIFVVFQIYLFSESPANEFGRGVLLSALSAYAFIGSIFRYFLISRLQKNIKRRKWLFLGERNLFDLFWKDYSPIKQSIGEVVFLSDDKEIRLDSPYKTSGFWTDMSYFKNQNWRGIVICSSKDIPGELMDQLFKLKISGVKMFDLTDFYQKYFLKVPVFFLSRSWLAFTQGFSLLHNEIGLRFKRICDVIGVIILIPVVFPFLVLGILLVLTSGWPIIFTQRRTGKNNKAFTIYKLRTMINHSEEFGAQWAKKKDHRITFFGNFLRKTRIDELPQLFNVLIGDMSFIGPRPERPEFNETLDKNIPHYSFRHVIRPGISGWAQVKYPYGASEEDSRQKLQYDLFYIKNYSLGLDIYIILKTIKVMLLGVGR